MTSKTKRRTKRKTRSERQIEEANRVAMLITSAPIVGHALAAPGLLSDKRLAPALALWREAVPMLEARRVLDASDRFQLAMLCYWWAEFVTAADDILRRGFSVMVKTISGDRMPRKNASANRRDHATDKIAELSAKFGLTPLDRYALQRAAKVQEPADDELKLTGRHGEAGVADWDEIEPPKAN
jgi:P27 family predicted phage terminase small subunit